MSPFFFCLKNYSLFYCFSIFDSIFIFMCRIILLAFFSVSSLSSVKGFYTHERERWVKRKMRFLHLHLEDNQLYFKFNRMSLNFKFVYCNLSRGRGGGIVKSHGRTHRCLCLYCFAIKKYERNADEKSEQGKKAHKFSLCVFHSMAVY